MAELTPAPGREARIAVWSGPRNISTALLRSWGSRPDTFVCDEPLYAHYLRATGLDHPGRDEIIARCETDWRAVVRFLTGPIPEGKTVDVPTGYVQFPKEILAPPRSVAERMYTDIRRWTVMSKGGHFAALEQPELLVREVREFFRPLR